MLNEDGADCMPKPHRGEGKSPRIGKISDEVAGWLRLDGLQAKRCLVADKTGFWRKVEGFGRRLPVRSEAWACPDAGSRRQPRSGHGRDGCTLEPDERCARSAAALTRLWIATWLALAVASPPAAGDPPCTRSGSCRDQLRLSTGKEIPYYRSFPLSRNDAITRVAIVIHGNRRNADTYFDDTVAAATAEKRLHDSVVLAPNFRTRADEASPDGHYWSSGGWKIGHRSRDSTRISSFAVMNEVLARICAAESPVFPRLQTVVLIGHSAGGQFVNRYAAGGEGCPNPAVEVRYVVMNPSSYLYVDGRRRSASTGSFEVPDSSCPEYDDYKYGLRDLNSYMKSIGVARIRANLLSRRTWYLAGEEDTGGGGSLDTRCQANLQGPNRLARFRNYQHYTRLFEDWTGAVFQTVPGIGHSGEKMLMSQVVRHITFR